MQGEPGNETTAHAKHMIRTPNSSHFASRTHTLHLLEDFRVSDGGWRLLDDLLVPTLHGAVATKERDSVAILVCQDLNLQVTGTARQEKGTVTAADRQLQEYIQSVKLLAEHVTLYYT